MQFPRNLAGMETLIKQNSEGKVLKLQIRIWKKVQKQSNEETWQCFLTIIYQTQIWEDTKYTSFVLYSIFLKFFVYDF